MDENEKKVSIKLERHKWPDEIAKDRKKKKTIVIIVSAILLSFAFGWSLGGFGNKNGGILPITNNADLGRFESVYKELLNSWYFSKEMENPSAQLIDNAIKGMLEENGDKHTNYLTFEEISNLNNSINMDFVGIGVQYTSADGTNLVTRVFKESPAEKSGVLPGDIIKKVDGQDIAELSSEEIKALIIGEAGTSVKVEFLRDGKVVSIDIIRGNVSAVVWGEILEDDVAYLEISSFGQQLAASTKPYLDDFLAKGADRLIIDLRDNGGGYLTAINELSKIFFENNDVIYSEEFLKGKSTVYNVKESEKASYPFKDIVLILNENSASASEVLALAMKENLGTKIVGVTSYGKGTVQTQRAFNDQSSLKITIAKWMSPHGNNINGIGIEPDFEVKLPEIFNTKFPVLEENEIVKFDSVSESVSYVQKALTYLNYHKGRTDGYYDQATQTALFAYQKALSFDQNSDINQERLSQLYSSVVKDWSMNRSTNDVQLKKAIEVIKNGS